MLRRDKSTRSSNLRFKGGGKIQEWAHLETREAVDAMVNKREVELFELKKSDVVRVQKKKDNDKSKAKSNTKNLVQEISRC